MRYQQPLQMGASLGRCQAQCRGMQPWRPEGTRPRGMRGSQLLLCCRIAMGSHLMSQPRPSGAHSPAWGERGCCFPPCADPELGCHEQRDQTWSPAGAPGPPWMRTGPGPGTEVQRGCPIHCPSGGGAGKVDGDEPLAWRGAWAQTAAGHVLRHALQPGTAAWSLCHVRHDGPSENHQTRSISYPTSSRV